MSNGQVEGTAWICWTEMIHNPGKMGQYGVRVQHATQNGMQLKTYELFHS